MFDSEIRQALKPEILSQMPASTLFEEMSLHRTARADVAAVNDIIWGFEIKGPRDSLSRLPLQIPYYQRVFDRSILVVSGQHLVKAKRAIPAAWGIWVVCGDTGRIEFEQIRAPKLNRKTDIESLIRLLNKREAIRVARKLGKPVSHDALVSRIWEHLATFPKRELQTVICEKLRSRNSLKSVA